MSWINRMRRVLTGLLCLGLPWVALAGETVANKSGATTVATADLPAVDAVELWGVPDLCPMVEPAPPGVALATSGLAAGWTPAGWYQLVVRPDGFVDGRTGTRVGLPVYLVEAQAQVDRDLAATGLEHLERPFLTLWIHPDAGVSTVDQVVRQAAKRGFTNFLVMVERPADALPTVDALPDPAFAERTVASLKGAWEADRQAREAALWRGLYADCPVAKQLAVSGNLVQADARCQVVQDAMLPAVAAACSPQVADRLATLTIAPQLVGTPAVGHRLGLSGAALTVDANQTWSDISEEVLMTGSLTLRLR